MVRVMNAANVKDAVRKRDSYKCIDCGMRQDAHIELTGKRLHVHRLKRRTPYTIEGCVTVCRGCHWNRHTSAGDLRGPERSSADRARIHPALANALGALADRNATTIPIEVNRAVRELLEREKLWPPK